MSPQRRDCRAASGRRSRRRARNRRPQARREPRPPQPPRPPPKASSKLRLSAARPSRKLPECSAVIGKPLAVLYQAPPPPPPPPPPPLPEKPPPKPELPLSDDELLVPVLGGVRAPTMSVVSVSRAVSVAPAPRLTFEPTQ